MTPASPQDEVVKTERIDAPANILWRVLTEPELVRGWMSDEELEVSLEPRLGSPITMRGRLHGLDFENRGVVTAFQPGALFEYRYWSTLSSARLDDLPENRTTVRFALAAEDHATVLTLTLRDFPEPSIRPHVDLYWGPTLRIIKQHAEQIAAASP